jgi:Icc-related predicted phosphoesterase
MDLLLKKNIETNTFINYVELIDPLPKDPDATNEISIVMISDIHNNQKLLNLPEADILLVAGDMTDRGSYDEISLFSKFLSKVKPKFDLIIVVAGNHEVTMDIEFYKKSGKKYFQSNAVDPNKIRSILLENKDIVYLEDSGYEYKGINIWGSPWVNPCGNWAFCLSGKDKGKEYFEKIPENTDILVTHSPPFGILDVVPYYNYKVNPETNNFYRVEEKDNTGNQELLNRVKVVKPKLHVFGHIHECSGSIVEDSTLFVNASILNRNHKPKNLPKKVKLSF